MKNLDMNLLKLSSRTKLLLLLIFCVGTPSFALERFEVKSLEGKVFASSNKKTWYLREGEKVSDQSDIVSPQEGFVELSDGASVVLKLSGDGQIQLFNEMLELKRGFLWVKASQRKKDLMIVTANSTTVLREGEFIISFDVNLGKTQVMALKESCLVSSIEEKNVKERISAGEFTFVQKDMNEGRPRPATPVSYESFKRLTDLFMSEEKEKSEEMAISKKPSVTFFSQREREEKTKKSIDHFYKKDYENVRQDLEKYKVPVWAQKSKVRFKIFGVKQKKEQVKVIKEKKKVVKESPRQVQEVNQIIDKISQGETGAHHE